MRYRIALAIAPAGWGKTAAVRAALDGAEHRWVDLSSERASFDPAALRAVYDGIVVVDGVHLLDGVARAALVESMRSDAPARWVLIGRRRDGLPIARWIAAGDAGAPVLFEDLALGAAEIDAGARNVGLHITAAVAEAMLERTGGWPVAVRFALSTLERSPDVERATIASRRLLFDYLSNEIFEALPDARRELLFALAMGGTTGEIRCWPRSPISAPTMWPGCAPASCPSWKRRTALRCIRRSRNFCSHNARMPNWRNSHWA